MNKFHSSQDILRELKQQRDNNPDLYIPVPTDKARTLLLMGPTRGGKSTIVKALQDSLYEPPRSTLFSGTRKGEHQQIGGLRIIDMPGFNDLQMQTRNSSLNNNTILTMLQTQLNDNDPVHLVAFVFSLSNGIKQEDINTMIYVQSNLPHLAKRTMLVVTHAEELNNEEKNNLVEEFFNHPDVKQHDLRNFFKKEILFIGCLRYESLNQLDYKALVHEHQNVLEMRKRFIEKCFEDESFFNNRQVKFIKSPSSPRSIRFYIYSILMVCALLVVAHQFGVFNKKTYGEDPANKSIAEDNKTLNASSLPQDEKPMPAPKNDNLTDINTDQSSQNTKLDTEEPQSNQAPNDPLDNILLQLDKFILLEEIQLNSTVVRMGLLNDMKQSFKELRNRNKA